MKRIAKVLSANDTGETGGHQAGILVPKNPEILAFFPPLSSDVKNPRHHLFFRDDTGEQWEFAFIYYNGRLFGGTRNEYRLTRMTPFMRAAGLKAGDELILEHREGEGYSVRYARAQQTRIQNGVLKLGGDWKVVRVNA
jgi:hypothetical protein